MQINDFFERHRPRTLSQVVGNEAVKRKLSRLIQQNAVPKGILIGGGSGCGKSTVARALARTIVCSRTSPTHLEPCGECYGCRTSEFGSTFWNAATISISRLKEIAIMASYKQDVPLVYLIDELHRATERIQDLLVTMLEDGLTNYSFIFCTLRPFEIEEPLLQRLIYFEMHPPPAGEMVEHMKKVCAIEGWRRDEALLRHIAEANGNVPRACLNALFQMSLEDDGSRNEKGAL